MPLPKAPTKPATILVPVPTAPARVERIPQEPEARGPEAPHGRIVSGRDALRAALLERDRELTGIRFSEAQVFAAGDAVIGTFRMTATRRADNAAVDLRGCDIYTVRDGLIASKDSYWKQVTAG